MLFPETSDREFHREKPAITSTPLPQKRRLHLHRWESLEGDNVCFANSFVECSKFLHVPNRRCQKRYCVPLQTITTFVIGQLSSRTRHRVLAVAALDKSLSMVWWRWHISVSQLCCCWSMAVSFWVASINVCVCFGVPPRECGSLN